MDSNHNIESYGSDQIKIKMFVSCGVKERGGLFG